ncbi:MAG: class I adenylate-forming enzyme family protein [Dehalococcoidales bacterium]|nr:class I adenylate-forming enzyme family protein [Dehalococcoidales bacterium]
MTKPTRYTRQQIESFVKNGVWKTTISSLWDRNAGEYPLLPAIADTTQEYTWAEALTWIDRVALGLIEMGMQRDEVLMAQLPNSVELHLLRVACEKAGILCLPVLTNMRESEIKYIAGYTDAAALVISDEFRGFNYTDMVSRIRDELPKLKHILTIEDRSRDSVVPLGSLARKERNNPDVLESRRYRPEDVSIVCLTSGSTGFPKFVEYPAGACASGGRYLADALGLTGSDIVAAIAPASRGPNVAVYYSAPQVAARMVMVPWLGAREALKAIEQKRVTVACLVPTQLALMLAEFERQPVDLSSLRLWVCAGSQLSPSLVPGVERRMGGTVINQYGAVDFGAITVTRPEDPFTVRAFSAGSPRLGVDVRINNDNGAEAEKGDVGEVLAKGTNAASGYYRDEDATDKAWDGEGWYATGDLGKIDGDGNLVIVGRKKEVIIRGGQNIYPAELESLLITHPEIVSSAVIAMPDPLMGEKTCAYLVLNGSKSLTLEDLTVFLKKKNIAPFKIPERVEIVDRLPTISDGQKIDKRALAQDIISKLKQEEISR